MADIGGDARHLGAVASMVVIAVPAALLAGHASRAVLFELSPYDLAPLAMVSAALVAIGLAAAVVPARRASTIDPVEALRAQ